MLKFASVQFGNFAAVCVYKISSSLFLFLVWWCLKSSKP